eukprot:6191400-Pleurochrysis_carterae.AAC.6
MWLCRFPLSAAMRHAQGAIERQGAEAAGRDGARHNRPPAPCCAKQAEAVARSKLGVVRNEAFASGTSL